MEFFEGKSEAFERAYVRQRNKEINRDLQVAQTKLRFTMIHLGSNIVPLPPVASFLSEKEKNVIMQEVKDTFNDDNFDELVTQEQKKTPHVCADKIRREIKNGMVYYLFYYVMKLQSSIDPSVLWTRTRLTNSY